MKTISKVTFGVLFAALTVWTFAVPDASGFAQPALARIFFWHFPCPILSTFLLWFSGYFSLRYLLSRGAKWELRAAASAELGFLFGLAAMASGMIFSDVQWGAFWQSDPRQTSYLWTLLLYSAYFVLRGAISDKQSRASYSAVYNLALQIPALFLTFIFPRLPQIKAQSFHPSDTITSRLLDGMYGATVSLTLVFVTILAVGFYRQRVAALEAAERWEQHYGNLEISGGSGAPTGVVRRVRVPNED